MKRTKQVISLIILCLFIAPFGINTYAEIINNRQIVSVGGENTTPDNVTVSKTIEGTNIENYFDITLKVTTTTRVDEIIRAQDLAIVLVMDISNTMNKSVDGVTRIEAAKDSVKDFIDNFYTFANEPGAESAVRKIGLVTFNSHSSQVFGLEDCKTTTQRDNLKNLVSNITAPIDTDQKFTNMEAGLSHARDLLNSTSIKNKYVIFLTDGLPTTYIKNYDSNANRYIGYSTNTSGTHKSTATPGYFYNYEKKVKISSGTNYSDYGARLAENVAMSIKNSGVKIYSIGVGITSQHTLFHLLYEGYAGTVDTDTEAKNYAYYGNRYYAVLPGVNVPSTNCTSNASVKALYNNTDFYKNWLRDYIGSGTNYYYDSTNKTDILAAYKSIFEGITQMTETSSQATWVAEDPMGASGSVHNIEFVGLYDDNNILHESLDSSIEGQSDTANFALNKISWDLKKSGYTAREEGNVTYYTYEVKYRVRLQNELNEFDITKIYDTNGLTRLTYVTRVDGVISEDKYVDFPIPSVKGYLGNFEFTKKSSVDGSTLSKVQFTLSHDTENCPCHNERKYPIINNFISTSDENGKVLFERIPSGHKYILTETKPPFDYIAISPMDVIVHFGNTGISTEFVSSDKIDNSIELPNGYTSIPSEYDLINEIKKTNLLIKKKVKGIVKENRSFEFKLDVFFNDKELTGEYTYKINNGEDKTINLSEDVIKLNNNDEIVIYNLPVGSTYKIQEVNVEGYHTEYQVNNEDIKVGKLATCDSNNSCRLESSDNSVIFTNYAEFILPKTGSSTTLIMIIIGTLLLVGPVIYISYLFYKDRFVS